jgi:hypothetical protein
MVQAEFGALTQAAEAVEGGDREGLDRAGQRIGAVVGRIKDR